MRVGSALQVRTDFDSARTEFDLLRLSLDSLRFRMIEEVGLLPYSERLRILQLTTLAERRSRGDLSSDRSL